MKSPKTRVLYVSANGYLGGAERFVLTAAKYHLAHRKIEIQILFFHDGEAVTEARSLGINCVVLESRFKLRQPLKLLQALFEIRKLVKAFRPDIIHFTMPYTVVTCHLALLGLRLKKVWFQHGPVGGFLDKLASLMPTDLILFNSRDLQQRHHQSEILNRSRRQEVLEIGIPGQVVQRKIFENQKIILTSAGRICSWKGFHTVIEALGEILKEGYPTRKWALRIAGNAKTLRDKDYLETLKTQVQNLGLDQNVEFSSHVTDMQSYLQNSDVFIHASTIPEPFGLVVAEAMLNGNFVIGSNQGGVRDILIEGKTGISFDPTSIAAVSELKKILLFWLSPESPVEQAQVMASRAQELILSKLLCREDGR